MSEIHSTGLTVIGAERKAGGRTWVLCRCECGKEKEMRLDAVRSGHAKSCGCRPKHRTHGLSMSRLYRAWTAMRQRCNDPNHKSFPGYGGRGIRVCERWRDFQAFASDMGEPGDGQSIDRIDNDGNYEPGNCRWTDNKTQQRNTRRNRLVTFQGRTQTMAAWCEEAELCQATIDGRLLRGWSIEKALTTPSLKPQMKGLKRTKFGG